MWFAAPKALFLLLGVPLVVLLYWLRWRQVQKIRQAFDGAQRVGNPAGLRQFTAALGLLLIGGASLVIAAAEPRIIRDGHREIYKKLDLVFLLDTSFSMRARDIAPSRIERAAEEIQNFIQYNQQYIGRVGLVSFSSSSIALSYLTSDPSNIHFFLEYLSTEAQPGAGTDIGAGVSSGLSLLDKEKSIDETWQTGGAVFVLISDGDDHGEGLKDAIRRAAQAGVRTYAVGIGSEMGDYIPTGEEEGRTIFLKDERGKQIITTLNEETLRWVADATGGTYFRSRSGDDLRRSLGEILQKERLVVDIDTSAQELPVHRWFLTVAFVALALRIIW